MIDPQAPRKALAQRQEPECDHPTNQIMDRPDKSYCRKCGQDVAPLMRDEPAKLIVDRENDRVIWDRGSPFSVFPSGE